MTFNRERILAEGGTYHGEDDPLIERSEFSLSKVSYAPISEQGTAPASIKEDSNLPKRMVIEGIFQRADIRNANQRVYPRSLWERLLSPTGAVQKRIADRAMIGHLEHPETGATDLNKGAIRVDKVWMENDGTVMGRAIVFNTPEGQRIQEYVATGTKIGISSRGTGTVDAKGVVCEDFGLETWDMVYNPSTPGAHPALKTESDREQPVHGTVVVENEKPTSTIPRQEAPMNLAERLAVIRDQVSRLTAIDHKRLTSEQKKKLGEDLLNLRITTAEEFSGEKRMAVEMWLKALDNQMKMLEDSDTVGGYQDSALGAAQGQTDAMPQIPGNPLGALGKGLMGLGGGERDKAIATTQEVANLIAGNLGKLPEIKTAIENLFKPAEKKVEETPPVAGEPKVEGTPVAALDNLANLSEEAKGLLIAAREELLSMTEREEAASAIIDEMTTQLAQAKAQVESLLSESATLKAAADAAANNAAEVIADLTSAKNAAKVSEAKEAAKAAPVAPAKPKSLAERLSKPALKSEGDEALPPKGKVVESTKDAGTVETKVLTESTSKGASLAASALAKMRAEVE